MDEASTKSFYNIYHMWRCTAILKQYVRVTLIQKEKLYKHFGDLNLELIFFQIGQIPKFTILQSEIF